MKFSIEIKEGWTRKYYQVELVQKSHTLEVYKITREDFTITLQSNRPMLRAKGLKYKAPIWKRIAGNDILASELERFIKAIMQKIDQ